MLDQWVGLKDTPYLKPIPCLGRNFFHHRLELRQPQEVHVAILLLVVFLITLCEIEIMEGVVVGELPFDSGVFSISEI